MNELEQCKNTLRSALMFIQGYGNRDKVLADIAAILNPVEYEEVEEIVGWVNVYQTKDGERYVGVPLKTEELADSAAAKVGHNRISCQPIRVTVKREKKRPVERSVTVDAVVDCYGIPRALPVEDTYAFRHNKDFHGCKGYLTFTTTEDPTT